MEPKSGFVKFLEIRVFGTTVEIIWEWFFFDLIPMLILAMLLWIYGLSGFLQRLQM